MVVVCNQCGTEYTFASGRALAANQSFQFRCTSCGHRFSVNQERLEDDGGPAPQAEPTAMLLRQGSDVYRVNGIATLQRWIVQLRVDRDDRLSNGDDRWERLGDIPELKQFFEVVDQAQGSAAVEDSPTESLSGLPPVRPQPATPIPPPMDERPSDRLMEREEPTEEASETTWDVPISDIVPDPSMPDVEPIPPPAEPEPDISEERFLADDPFFSEPQPAVRAPINSDVDGSDDDLDWQPQRSNSNALIIGGVIVAAILLLLLVRPWESPEQPASLIAPAEDAEPTTPEEPTPPIEEPPTEEPAEDASPEEPAEEPAEDAPVEEPPAEEPTEEPAPAEEPPAVEEPPAEEPVAEEPPVEEPPAEEPAPEPVAEAPTPEPAKTPGALATTAWSAIDRGQFSKARDLFSQALDISPGHVESRFGLGYSFEKLGDSETALTHYCRALSSAGGDVATKREVEGRLRAMNRQCG